MHVVSQMSIKHMQCSDVCSIGGGGGYKWRSGGMLPRGKFELLGYIRWFLAIIVHSKVDLTLKQGLLYSNYIAAGNVSRWKAGEFGVETSPPHPSTGYNLVEVPLLRDYPRGRPPHLNNYFCWSQMQYMQSEYTSPGQQRPPLLQDHLLIVFKDGLS